MLSENSRVFTRENLDLFFRDLSKEYKRLGGRHVPVEIVLIGGAAIIENYGFREMTTDIDALLPEIEMMTDAIHRVGDAHGLPNGWLNADFVKTATYSVKLRRYSVPYKTFNQVLNVRMITGEYLIAMKLRSGRRYKNDLSDIIGILAAHRAKGEPITFEQISTAVINLYDGWDDFPEGMLSFIQQVLAVPDLAEAYEQIRGNEQNLSVDLIGFDEKYPDILTERNLADVENRTRAGKQSLEEVLEHLKER